MLYLMLNEARVSNIRCLPADPQAGKGAAVYLTLAADSAQTELNQATGQRNPVGQQFLEVAAYGDTAASLIKQIPPCVTKKDGTFIQTGGLKDPNSAGNGIVLGTRLDVVMVYQTENNYVDRNNVQRHNPVYNLLSWSYHSYGTGQGQNRNGQNQQSASQGTVPNQQQNQQGQNQNWQQNQQGQNQNLPNQQRNQNPQNWQNPQGFQNGFTQNPPQQNLFGQQAAQQQAAAARQTANQFTQPPAQQTTPDSYGGYFQ